MWTFALYRGGHGVVGVQAGCNEYVFLLFLGGVLRGELGCSSCGNSKSWNSKSGRTGPRYSTNSLCIVSLAGVLSNFLNVSVWTTPIWEKCWPQLNNVLDATPCSRNTSLRRIANIPAITMHSVVGMLFFLRFFCFFTSRVITRPRRAAGGNWPILATANHKGRHFAFSPKRCPKALAVFLSVRQSVRPIRFGPI